jgi:hypothetical protein
MGSLRCVYFLIALLAPAVSIAASVADRSPFAQGHWWDPSRSGNGFEMFNAVGTVQVIWYTFDEERRPVWYTAQGPEASLGQADWPLLHHRWVGGRKAEPTTVGALRVTLRHAEAADITWRIGARQGSWPVEPFRVAGALNEVDHTGSWFDPDNSGWGVSLTEQGDVLGGVLFTYTGAGDPTWVSGFERAGNGSAAMYAATGSCPGCERVTTVTRPAGRLSFTFRSETRLTLRAQLDFAMAAGVNADGAALAMLSRPASWRAADRQLASFPSEAGLRDYLAAGVPAVQPMPIWVLPSTPPSTSASTAFSTTNLQEAGVDEPDFVKSNGRQVYTFAHDSSGYRVPRIRIARVEDGGTALVPGGAVAAAGDASLFRDEPGLVLHGDRLAVVAGASPWRFGFSPWSYPAGWIGGKTHIEVMGLANPEAPASLWRAQFDGSVAAARRIGSRLYVVTRFAPTLEGYRPYASGPAEAEANRLVLARAPLAALLPNVRVNGGEPVPAVAASAVFLPPQGARQPTSETTLVTAIDLAAPGIVQSLALAGPVEAVYASAGHLYVATSRWALRSSSSVLLPEPAFHTTEIHQLRLGAQSMEVVGSGAVEGLLSSEPDLAPFRFGEHLGRLGVVTASNTMWGAAGPNRFTILEPSTVAPGLLRTVSSLPNARRPEPLGKPGERLYGTRFVGDRLYAVTFMRTDPLYVVDFADAADPRIAAALELPGFSEYLHPLPGGLLLGFGLDSALSADGRTVWFQGLHLTLFDVADAAAPRVLERVFAGKRGSDSALLRSHHAFSLLERPDGTRSIAIPAEIHDGVYAIWGSGPSAMYPWSHSGVLRFDLSGGSAADARLTQRPTMATHTIGSPGGIPNDPARGNGRSVIFANGTVYVGNGLYWLGNDAGGVAGPF